MFSWCLHIFKKLAKFHDVCLFSLFLDEVGSIFLFLRNVLKTYIFHNIRVFLRSLLHLMIYGPFLEVIIITCFRFFNEVPYLLFLRNCQNSMDFFLCFYEVDEISHIAWFRVFLRNWKNWQNFIVYAYFYAAGKI